MTIKINNVIGYITPLASETRLRWGYSTYAEAYATSYGTSHKVEIDQIIERLETSTDPMKIHDRAGDIWGRVTKINGVSIPQPAFMAIQYHEKTTFATLPICSRHYQIVGEPEPIPDPTPNPTFTPFSFNFTMPGSNQEIKLGINVNTDSMQIAITSPLVPSIVVVNGKEYKQVL